MAKNICAILQGIKSAVGRYKVEWHARLNPFQILIGTILSARTKDEHTAKAVKQLFAKYKTPEQIARAPLLELQRLIKPSGFYRVKARHIKTTSEMILERFGGQVPSTFEHLLQLPGVGRKVANCVFVYGFNKPAIPVDVHVHRVSNRIGLVKTRAPEQTEFALTKAIQKKYWIEINELFVLFGQNICLPKKPLCSKCPITKHCDYYKTTISK